MGFGYRKSFKVAPGVRLNVSKSGIGASVGGKGLRYSVNSKGSRVTASVPGTGLSYSKYSSKRPKTSAYQYQQELQKQQREKEKLQQLEYNKLEVQLFENRLEMIKSIHKECDDPVDWNEVKNTPSPLKVGGIGPKEVTATEALILYKPGFFSKLFKQDQKKREALQKAVIAARSEDQADYNEWEQMIETATRIVNRDVDAYFEVIEDFAPFDDLTEFGSGFEFFIEDQQTMEIDFDVHTSSVVPTQRKTLTKTGKVSVSNMPKTQYFDIQQDYVCSCILRIARDTFALLPLSSVYINALDERINTVTGQLEKEVILSIRIDRHQLVELNFDRIDCSDAMANFEHHMVFKKTKGFEQVERLLSHEINMQ
ncbi:DUF4236 domain-containing protein [Fictibacillus enclensis]|uniref:DUF4236 domain-containing protein n=1 Tax=Fictibacillus enclensis TaxID=1017270 RepID=UPI0025A1BFA7|nr:DUF4236 domain-containing protein [Fictibacillus enclensis]MDM5338494.1 DUF4236 domain-containing protein [Fictibacillus enclensis]